MRLIDALLARSAAVSAGVALVFAALASPAAALRILPLGDSITDGFTVPGGYRAPLYQLLTNAGYSVDFVGTQQNNRSALLGDPDHEGHSGYRIDQIQAGIAAWLDAVDEPDVILLLMGTNDYGQDHETPEAIRRLDKLVAQLVALRPKARIVVANLLPRVDNPAADAAIQRGFNPFVADLVAAHAASGQRVFYLDLRSALNPADLADGLHPNQTGYHKLATNWFGMITKLVAVDRAGSCLIDFDGACVDGGLVHAAMPSTYQPVPGLTLGYLNVGIFNQGPDHTAGVSGTNHYNTFSLDGKTPQVFTFSRPVSVSSVYLSTYSGATNGANADVAIRAFADVEGEYVLTNVTVATPPHPFGGQYEWVGSSALAGLGGRIMRLEFFSAGIAQVDDLSLDVTSNPGALQSVRLKSVSPELYVQSPAQLKAVADYAYLRKVDVTVGSGVAYLSSDTNTVTISSAGWMRGIRPGRATVSATLGGSSDALSVSVLPGALVDFNTGLDQAVNRTTVPADYQPVPGVRIGYRNVGIFNGGPDHTTGVMGRNRFNTYQFQDGSPQVFTFNRPVSVPSLWLATFTGSEAPVIIQAFSDEQGAQRLGTVSAATMKSGGAGSYAWAQCTNLADAIYNGRIRRLEIATANGGNANLDDLAVVVAEATGALQALRFTVPGTPLFVGASFPAKVTADYERYLDSEVTKGFGVAYSSSDSRVVTVNREGLISAVGKGLATVTATLGNRSCSQAVSVLPGQLIDFSSASASIGNFVSIPSEYQPVPGMTIGYENVGLFNGGPDHTAGLTGENHYNAYQRNSAKPQAFTFSHPVSLPVMSLATYAGSGSQITLSAFGDIEGTELLGSVFFTPPISKGAGQYVWAQCTNFNSAAFNEAIRRLEVFGTDNANLDDLVVEVKTNLGVLQNIALFLPATNLLRGMSRQAAVAANYGADRSIDVTRRCGVAYTSSDTNVAVVDESGVVRAVGAGQAIIAAAFQNQTSASHVTVQAMQGMLVHFNSLPAIGSKVLLPAGYQPIPGLKLGYANVGIYNEGPDHTTGEPGAIHYNTYQYHDGEPQVFTFSKPVSLPSLWLSTYWGSGDQITISAYSDVDGKYLLGTLFVSSATFPGPGNYRWVECTNLDTTAYNGRIRRVELLGNTGNAQLDDLMIR